MDTIWEKKEIFQECHWCSDAETRKVSKSTQKPAPPTSSPAASALTHYAAKLLTFDHISLTGPDGWPAVCTCHCTASGHTTRQAITVCAGNNGCCVIYITVTCNKSGIFCGSWQGTGASCLPPDVSRYQQLQDGAFALVILAYLVRSQHEDGAPADLAKLDFITQITACHMLLCN